MKDMDVISIISFAFSAIKKTIVVVKKHNDDRNFNNAIKKDLEKLIKEYYSLFDFEVLFSVEDFFEKYTDQVLNETDISNVIDEILSTVDLGTNDIEVIKEFLNKLANVINKEYLLYYADKATKATINVLMSAINDNKTSSKDREKITTILSKLLSDGNYEELYSSLSLIRKHDELKDIYYKYLLQYSCICEENVDYCVQYFVDSNNTNSLDYIFKILIKYNKIETINKYIHYLPDEYKTLVDSLNNQNIDYCFSLIKSLDSDLKNIWIICLLYKVIVTDPQKRYGFSFENLTELPFYIRILIRSIPMLNSLREGIISVENNSDVSVSKDKINRMNKLHRELFYATEVYECKNKEELKTIIPLIDKDIYDGKYIQGAILYKKILLKEDVIIDDAIDMSNTFNCGGLLFLYLTTYMKFEETHAFLCSNHYLLLKFKSLYVMYFKMLIQANSIDELATFLKNNKSISSDINYKLATLCIDSSGSLIKEVESLLSNLENYYSLDIILFVFVVNHTNCVELLYKYRWDYFKLNKQISEYLMYLLFQNEKCDKSFLLSLCDTFINDNPNSYILYSYSGTLSDIAKDYFEALRKYETSFKIQPNLDAAIRWISCELSHKGDLEENDLILFCADSINGDAQLLVSDFYLSKNNIEKSIFHLTNAYLLGCNNLKGIGSVAFRIATYHFTAIGNKKSVSDNVCVSLINKENKKSINICIYKRNKITKNITSFEKDGMFHYFDDDKEINDILYSKKKEKVVFKGETYTISNITSVILPLHDIGIQLMSMDGEMIMFSYQDPKDGVSQLIDYFKDKNEQLRKNVDKNLSIMGKAPLEAIARNLGKYLIELISSTQNYYKSNLLLNDAMVKENYDKVVLSFDTCVLLSQLEIDLSILKEKAIIPFSVKNKILKECHDLLNEMEIDNDSRFLFFNKEEQPSYHETSSEDKRARREFLVKLKELTESLHSEDKENKINDKEIIDVLKSINDECSVDTVATALKYDSPLFTDDVFLARMALYYKGKTFGITQFVFDSITDISVVQSLLIKLTGLNYFPVINGVFFDEIIINHSYRDAITLISNVLSFDYNIDEINKRVNKQRDDFFDLFK